jgi:hypothetical protein
MGPAPYSALPNLAILATAIGKEGYYNLGGNYALDLLCTTSRVDHRPMLGALGPGIGEPLPITWMGGAVRAPIRDRG